MAVAGKSQGICEVPVIVNAEGRRGGKRNEGEGFYCTDCLNNRVVLSEFPGCGLKKVS